MFFLSELGSIVFGKCLNIYFNTYCIKKCVYHYKILQYLNTFHEYIWYFNFFFSSTFSNLFAKSVLVKFLQGPRPTNASNPQGLKDALGCVYTKRVSSCQGESSCIINHHPCLTDLYGSLGNPFTPGQSSLVKSRCVVSRQVMDRAGLIF